MKLKKIILLLVLLGFARAISQEKEFIVKDAHDQRILPFASIHFFDGFGAFGDEDGKVVLEKKAGDSIKISLVGYKSKVVKLHAIDDFVLLEKDTLLLKEVVLLQQKKAERKGKTVKPIVHNDVYKMYWSAMGQQYAFYIPHAASNSFLKSIEIPIIEKDFDPVTGSGPLKRQDFKILIKMEFFSNRGDSPGEKLYDFEQFEIINSTAIKDRFALNLDKKISIPEEGLFTVMTIYGKADESDRLKIEMSYHKLLVNGVEKKNLKLIQPNFPLVESPAGTLTYFRHIFTKEQDWYRINKPMLYIKGKEYSPFNIGIGYTTVIIE